MNNNGKKKAKKCIAAVLTIALVGGGFYGYGRVETKAQEKTLPGIEKIVAEYQSAGRIFHILEIVPKEADASIGYLIGGEEPVGEGRKLSEIPSAVERAAKMDALKASIDAGELAYLTGSGEAPFTFEPYAEAADAGRSVQVKGQFLLNTEGNGAYKYKITNTVYIMLTDENAEENKDKQRFDRLISFEEASADTPAEKRVVLTFTPVSSYTSYPDVTVDGIETGKAAVQYMLGDSSRVKDISIGADFAPDAYVGKEIYIKTTASGSNGLYDNYAYSATVALGENVPDEYQIDQTLSGTPTDPGAGGGNPSVSDSDPAVDAGNPSVSGGDAGTLVSEKSLYILDAQAGQAYLWISCVRDDQTGQESYNIERIAGDGEYFADFVPVDYQSGDNYCISAMTPCEKGNLAWNDKYEPNDVGKYVVKEAGQITVVHKSEPEFAQEDMGTETYDFIGDGSKEAVETVAYNGGISNKEWFKKNVLDLSDDEIDKLQIEVTTLTLAQLADLVEKGTYCGIELDEVDFLYLSGRGDYSAAVGGVDPVALNGACEKLAKIALGVEADGTVDKLSRVPVVMDYGFYGKNADNEALSSLALLLLQGDNEAVVTSFAQNGSMKGALAEGFSLTGNQYLAGSVYLNDDQTLPYAAYDYLTPMEGGRETPFEAVRKEIENENFISSQNGGQEQMDTVITKASITRYIMNWSRQRTTVKSSLRVLDLEPCYDFDGSNVLSAALIKQYMNQPDYQGDIQITQMPSAEFIGKIEDLNEQYDLIYVGARTGQMNTDTGGNTLYNDSKMNGLIYTHVGDLYKYSKESSENKMRLKDDFLAEEKSGHVNDYRGPGNDINSTREEEFEQYIKAGYPVIFAETLLSDINGQVQVNSARVDCNSYFYKLINFALSKDDQGNYLYWQKNVYADSQLLGTEAETQSRQETFCKYLNLSKLEIEWVTDLGEEYMPVEYDEDVSEGSRYLRPDGGHYYLQYIFSLENDAAASQVSTTYDCRLYIDSNADGRFAGSDYSANRENDASEELKGVALYVKSSLGWEQVSQKEVDGVLRYELLTGQTYKVVRQVPDDYQGMLPWKLVFYDNADVLVRTSKTGYTAINRDDKAKIRVLQLMSDKEPTSKSGKVNWNLQKDDDVKELLKDIPGFDVEITSVKTSSFVKKEVMPQKGIAQNASSDAKEAYYRKCYEAAYAEFSTYDMVILGFGDTYQFGSKNYKISEADDETGGTVTVDQTITASYANAATAEAVRDYIEDGKSVLFTHDSSSYINSQAASGESWYWGYEFNKTVRASVGLDRYGALIRYYRQMGKDESLSEDARDRYNAYLKVLEEQYQYDTMVQPGDPDAEELPQKEGLTRFTVVRFMAKHLESLIKNKGSYSQVSGEGKFYFPVKNPLLYKALYKEGDASKSLFGTYDNFGSKPGATLTATMVNEGQITNYPFKISDDELRTLEVANTHYQWMQPNMELDRDHDGKNDIVVWYCLSDLSNKSTAKKEGSDGYSENIYNICPNDVVNNYYIYSMGNVTYSGAGHTAPTNLAEKKLFVNTMVAAYSAGVKSPSVAFCNEAGDPVKSVYMMYDAANHKVLGEKDSVKVQFQAVDYNILAGLSGIRVEFFAEVPEGTAGAVQVDGIAGWVVPLDSSKLKVTSASGELGATAADGDNSMDGYFKGSFYTVQSDAVYTLKISDDLLGMFQETAGDNMYLKDTASASTIYIRATTMYENGEKRTDSSAQELAVSVAELFDLK